MRGWESGWEPHWQWASVLNIKIYRHVPCKAETGGSIKSNTTSRLYECTMAPNDVILWRHLTAWRHALMSHDVLTSLHGPRFCIMPFKSEQVWAELHENHNFSPGDLDLWPWPLIYDLDHRTWPRYVLGRCPCKISCPYNKQFSCKSAHRHTHGTDSITSTADAGGKNRDGSSMQAMIRVWYNFQPQYVDWLILCTPPPAYMYLRCCIW